jgi:hypothetical protein
LRFSIVALDGLVLSDEEATAADRCDADRGVEFPFAGDLELFIRSQLNFPRFTAT